MVSQNQIGLLVDVCAPISTGTERRGDRYLAGKVGVNYTFGIFTKYMMSVNGVRHRMVDSEISNKKNGWSCDFRCGKRKRKQRA